MLVVMVIVHLSEIYCHMKMSSNHLTNFLQVWRGHSSLAQPLL